MQYGERSAWNTHLSEVDVHPAVARDHVAVVRLAVLQLHQLQHVHSMGMKMTKGGKAAVGLAGNSRVMRCQEQRHRQQDGQLASG